MKRLRPLFLFSLTKADTDFNLYVMSENYELSPQDREEASAFSEQIHFDDPEVILRYGSQPENEMNAFIDAHILDLPCHARNKAWAEMRSLTESLTVFEHAFDEPEETEDSEERRSFFTKEYQRIVREVNRTSGRLAVYRDELTEHMHTLQTADEDCVHILREYDMYILAGKTALERAENTPADGRDAFAAQDRNDALRHFEKRLEALSLSRQIPLEMRTQIRMIGETETVLVSSLRMLEADAFPLFKSRVILAVDVHDEDGNLQMLKRDVFTDACETLIHTLQSIAGRMNDNEKHRLSRLKR